MKDCDRMNREVEIGRPLRNCNRFETAEEAKKEFNYLWNFVQSVHTLRPARESRLHQGFTIAYCMGHAEVDTDALRGRMREVNIEEINQFFDTHDKVKSRIAEIAPLCTHLCSREQIMGFHNCGDGDICCPKPRTFKELFNATKKEA